MNFSEAAILLTCHSFEDFPVYYEGEDAEALLSAWTALWHPALIAQTGKKPTWYRVDQPPSHDQARLLVLPESQSGLAPDDLAEAVASAGGRLIEKQVQRAAILEQALPSPPPQVDPELAADLMALGYAQLQVELLTRHMRYSTQMEETSFEENLVAAANAAMNGDAETCRSHIQTCYDFLSQERDHYYAVDIYLVDLSLCNESLLSDPNTAAQLQASLDRHTKPNLLLEGRLLEQLPEQLKAQLRQAWDAAELSIAGGDFRELPTSLLSSDTLQAQLRHGHAEFQRHFDRVPKVYGRRTFGLASCLPQLLLRMGYEGALHATFDGGRFPEANQSKSRWEGEGEYALDAIIRAPHDANDAATFLKLAGNLSESIDMDHIATRGFVHWAGQTSPWYEDLQRVTKYTAALGRFVTLEQYFQETYDPGLNEPLSADQYRSPWLNQMVSSHRADPVSRWHRYWSQLVAQRTRMNMATLGLMVSNTPDTQADYREAQAATDAFHHDPFGSDQQAASNDSTDDATLAIAQKIVDALPSGGSDESGYVIWNPTAAARRIVVSPSDVRPSPQPPVYAVSAATESPTTFIADAPAMGMLTVRSSTATGTTKRRKPLPPLAESELLRNDFFEVKIDRASGGLRDCRLYNSRSNRITQQLALRTPGKTTREAPTYSKMVATSIEIKAADTLHGCIECVGELRNASNDAVAKFRQTYEVWRGSRVLGLKIELEPLIELTGKPWEHYFGSRFVWPNEAASLSRSLNDVQVPARAKRIHAPLMLEVDDGNERTAILTGGYPFHRRTGRRSLDTVLIVAGESQRCFELGIGIDLGNPMQAALNHLSPTIVLPSKGKLPQADSAWLFHLATKQVVASTWHPIMEQERIVGFHTRLVEVKGRKGKLTLRALHPIESATKIAFKASEGRIGAVPQTLDHCDIDGDTLSCKVNAYEYLDIEARFVKPIELSAAAPT